jgi:DsbC/DsbD-like thiol-disulfide interchange protein
VLYPAPRRFSDPDGDVIGYKGGTLLPIVLEAEDAGKPMDLKLMVELGVCKDICVPVTLNLALSLPDARALPPSAELAAALDSVPRAPADRRSGDPVIERQTATLTGGKPRLVFEAAFPAGTAGADLFVEAPDGAWVPFPVVKPDPDGRRVTFDIDLSAGADLKDLIGKTLTVTVIGPTGALETTTVLKAE